MRIFFAHRVRKKKAAGRGNPQKRHPGRKYDAYEVYHEERGVSLLKLHLGPCVQGFELNLDLCLGARRVKGAASVQAPHQPDSRVILQDFRVHGVSVDNHRIANGAPHGEVPVHV
jgi:hypothetical protein